MCESQPFTPQHCWLVPLPSDNHYLLPLGRQRFRSQWWQIVDAPQTGKKAEPAYRCYPDYATSHWENAIMNITSISVLLPNCHYVEVYHARVNYIVAIIETQFYVDA